MCASDLLPWTASLLRCARPFVSLSTVSTWSATADYYLPLTGDWGMNVGGGYRFTDDRVSATTQRQSADDGTTVTLIDLTPGQNIDSYQALDLYLSVSNANWSIRGYMKNAFDERAYSTMANVTSPVTGLTHHTSATPIMPRTFGIEVDYRF